MVSKGVATVPEATSSVNQPPVPPEPRVDKTARDPNTPDVSHAEPLDEHPGPRRRTRPRATKPQRNSEGPAELAVETSPPSAFRTFLTTVSSALASSDDEEDGVWVEQSLDPLEAS